MWCIIEMCISLLLAASIHLGLDADYQNVHPHVQCEVEHSLLNSTIIGAYYNSESKISTYVGQKFGRVEVGLVTGYSSYSLLPFARVKYRNWYITPAYEKDNWGIVLGWETKIF